MHIKTVKKMTGIPQGEIAVSPMVLDNGMPQVFVAVSATAMHQKDVVLNMRLSPNEARGLAQHLLDQANASELLANGELKVSDNKTKT